MPPEWYIISHWYPHPYLIVMHVLEEHIVYKEVKCCNGARSIIKIPDPSTPLELHGKSVSF
jgi:hypothetical protein